MDTIKQAMTEYIKISNLENENAELKTYKEILQDKDKLVAYLEEQQNTGHLFSIAPPTDPTSVKIMVSSLYGTSWSTW